MAVAAAALIGALFADYPLVSGNDRERWLKRVKPRHLFEGRSPRRRVAVWLLIACAVLSLGAVFGEIFGLLPTRPSSWIWFVDTLLPVASLILIDISQHSEVTTTD